MWLQNTERASSLLIGALKQFPMEYIFNLVYKLDQVRGLIYPGMPVAAVKKTKKNHYIFPSQLRADQTPGPPREGS